MGIGIDDIGNALKDAGQAGISLVTGDVDDARAHLSDADSAITGDTTNSDNASAEARREHDAGVGDHQRERLGVQQAALTQSVDGGFDGRSVTNFENYASFDHPELYAKAQEMKSAPLQETASTWTTTGTSVKTTFETLGQSLSSAIANGWEGDGAAAATATSTRYVQQASALQPAFALTGSKLQEAASGVGETNLTVPQPVEFNRTHANIHNVMSVLSGGPPDADTKAQQAAMDAAHAEAVQVMNTTYKPVLVSADSGVPTFAAPSSPTTGDVAPTPPPFPDDRQPPGPLPWHPQTRPGEGYAGGTPNGQIPNDGNNNGSNGSQPRPGQIAPTGTPTAGSGGTGAGSGSNGDPAAAVSSAGYTPPGFGGSSGYGGASQGAGAGYGSGGYGGAGYGAGAGHGSGANGAYGSGANGAYGSGANGAGGYGAGSAAGYGGGGFGGAGSDPRGGTAGFGGAGGSAGSRGYGGSGGYGSGGSGSGGSGSGGSSGLRGGGGLGGGPGVTGAGPGVGAAGGASGTGGGPGAGAAGAAGSSGARSGSGGGMGGGRGGKGEEDYEHNTPSYLITDDNGSELVGKLPMVSPAVIGE